MLEGLCQDSVRLSSQSMEKCFQKDSAGVRAGRSPKRTKLRHVESPDLCVPYPRVSMYPIIRYLEFG